MNEDYLVLKMRRVTSETAVEIIDMYREFVSTERITLEQFEKHISDMGLTDFYETHVEPYI